MNNRFEQPGHEINHEAPLSHERAVKELLSLSQNLVAGHAGSIRSKVMNFLSSHSELDQETMTLLTDVSETALSFRRAFYPLLEIASGMTTEEYTQLRTSQSIEQVGFAIKSTKED